MERIARVLKLVFKNIYTYRVDYIRTFAILRLVHVLIILPLISLVFRGMLTLLHIQSITEQNIFILLANPLVWFVLLFILLVMIISIYYEMGFLMLMAYHQQRGLSYTITGLWRRLNQKLLYFVSIQTVLLMIYLMLVIPLISTVLPLTITQNLQIPRFIVDELMASTQGKLLYFSALTALLLIGLRFIFTLPYFTVYQWTTIWEAVKLSWQYSHRKVFDTIGMLAFILFVHLSILIPLLTLAFMPLFIVERTMPGASLFTAALTLTVVEAILLIGFTFLQGMFSQILVLVSFDMTRDEPPFVPCPRFRDTIMKWTMRIATVMFMMISVFNYMNLQRTIYEPSTKIIAHRGFISQAVENTMSGLIESHKAGAEMVEIDIQQTKDGQFVVFHDATLARLAGRNDRVADMTLDELTRITVRAGSYSDQIASLEEMLTKSKELNIRLLIEVKPHGQESKDYIEQLLALIDKHGGLDFHYIQSLNYNVVEKVKMLEPRIKAGMVYALNLGALPETSADFIALEQYFVTNRIIELAHEQKKELFVWTVNTNASIQNFYLIKVDGVITNHPDYAYTIREKLGEDEYFMERLLNKLTIIF